MIDNIICQWYMMSVNDKIKRAEQTEREHNSIAMWATPLIRSTMGIQHLRLRTPGILRFQLQKSD